MKSPHFQHTLSLMATEAYVLAYKEIFKLSKLVGAMFKPNKLKYSNYFVTSVVIRRPYLTEEVIVNVLMHFKEKIIQENGRVSYTGYDFEAKKYLKVITEELNKEQIIFNAFYDRNFLKKRNKS